MLCRDNSVDAGHGHLTVMNTQRSQCSVYNIHYEVSIQRAVMAVQVESVSGSVAMFITDRTRTGAGALTGQYSRAMTVTVVHCYEAA